MASAEDPTQKSRCTRRRALSCILTIPHRQQSRSCAKTPLAAPTRANPVALQSSSGAQPSPATPPEQSRAPSLTPLQMSQTRSPEPVGKPVVPAAPGPSGQKQPAP
eukprot:6213576-Pleurochrysis_carterae.AAC.1